jgi:N-acetylmuramoyl-L-alanine amidase
MGLHVIQNNFRFLCRTLAVALPLLAVAPASAEPVCDTAKFRIVLDVGHTTFDTGAISSHGATEFSFNLRLTRELEQKLGEAGFRKITTLVMDGRGKPSLYSRMAIANAAAPDLFLSIHHDAVPDNFVEKWSEDGATRNFSDRFKGHSIFVSPGARYFKESLQFGKLIGEHMRAEGLVHTPHYTEAFMGKHRHPYLDAVNGVYSYEKLHVLRTARAPAVLLEAGSILNRQEEIDLNTPERRAKIVNATAQAIEDYCAQHMPAASPLMANFTPPRKTAMKQARKRVAHRIHRVEATAIPRESY